MDQQLQVALAELINSVISAKDFIVAETPDVIQQLLVWKFYEQLSFFLCSLILVIFTAWAAPKTIKMCVKDEDEEDLMYRYSPVVSFNMLWGFMIIPVTSLMNITWLKILIAPKIFLIEYAASLVK